MDVFAVCIVGLVAYFKIEHGGTETAQPSPIKIYLRCHVPRLHTAEQ